MYQKLDICEAEDMKYEESFAALMELDEPVEEDAFFGLFSEVSIDEMKELSDKYLEEIVSSIPDDRLEFYTLMSSYKRNLRGFFNYHREEGNRFAAISELFRFREWYRDSEKVLCTDLNDNREFKASVCEALFMERMERMSLGRFSLDFESAMDLDFDEFEDYADDDEGQDDFIDIDENNDNDPRITLVDPVNPVIDGEKYEDEYENGGEYLQ